MTTRIAISGLGRIGRCLVHALAKQPRENIEIVALNAPADIDTIVHLLRYDSISGPCLSISKAGEDTIQIGDHIVPLFHSRDPLTLPWKELNVDVVQECTGHFKTRQKAAYHLEAGAKKVVISAPSPDADAMIIVGVPHNLRPEDDIISVGSCTTNCLAPVASVLDDKLGIIHGFMTTIHSYTSDQNLHDNSHSDLRRARSAPLSMVPTSTGAAKAIGQVLPALAGKIDGIAIRVPTPNVSYVDFTFTSQQATSKDAINSLFEEASKTHLRGILAYETQPLVSIDFTGNPHSAIVDASGTYVVGDNFCRVAAWYDNEWAFSERMLDVTEMLGTFV